MTKEQIQSATEEQILPQVFRDLLSFEAVQIYKSLWYRGASKDAVVQVVDDIDLIKRARLPAYKVQPAIDELVRAGLLAFNKLRDCGRYELLPLPLINEEQSDEQLWANYSVAL